MADSTLAQILAANQITALGNTDTFYVGPANATSDAAITFADMQLNLQKNTKSIYAALFKATDGTTKSVKADGKKLIDCTTTTAGLTISSASYQFTAADVGKLIVVGNSTVEDVRAPGAYVFRGTIASVNTGTGVATLSGAAGVTATGNGVCTFGTDDTVALQAALDTAAAPDSLQTGNWTHLGMGCVILPVGKVMVTASINMRPNVSIVGQGMRQSELYWASAAKLGGTGNEGLLNGYVSNGSSRRLMNVQLRDFAINCYSAFVSPYSYNNKTLVATYFFNMVIKNCAFLGSPGTGIGIDYGINALIEGNYIENPGRLFVSTGGGGSGIDFQSNKTAGWVPYAETSWEGYIIANNTILNPAVSGIRNTNNQTYVGTTKTSIIGNRVFTNKNSGKGIEDCGNNGALIIGNVCVNSFAGGESSSGNAGVDQESWGGIISYGGQNGIIANNRIQGYNKGVRFLRFLYNSSNLLPDRYIVNGNMITDCYDRGISIEVDSTYSLNCVSIRNNDIYDCGGEGISVTNNGTGGNIYDLVIQNNRIHNCAKTATGNRKSAIYINTAVDVLHCTANTIVDRQGTPTMTNGITVDGVAVTNEWIRDNHMKVGIATPFNLANSGTLANGTPAAGTNYF